MRTRTAIIRCWGGDILAAVAGLLSGICARALRVRAIVVLGTMAVCCSSAFAHSDTIITLGAGGQLQGLPAQYQPASLDLSSGTLRIAANTLKLPVCVSKYFSEFGKHDLKITASWYHTRSALPPYLNFGIKPTGKDYELGLLFALDTLKPILFKVITRIDESSWMEHNLKIDERCLDEIDRSITRASAVPGASQPTSKTS